MSHGLEDSPGPADQAVANDYDSIAEAYAAETESNLINGYYTRPAVLAKFPPGAFLCFLFFVLEAV
jgi:hypothetical protein